ncbi:MAG: hypothetical protein CV087_00100 [Candidatus Brocadia sp. WS118]|nr:MAG: hypothetical protein CV087_00100 [Candidatus Brocadia sp. WS118]
MKVLHMHHLYRPFGGGERYLLDLCDILEEKGHRTVIVSSKHPANYHRENRKEFFIERSFGLRTGYKMWGVINGIVKQENPDIIHLHETFVFMSPFIIRRLIHLKPTVQTIHTSFFFCPKDTKILPGGDFCYDAMGTWCIRNGCMREFNLRLAFNKSWRNWVTRKVDKIIVPSHYLKEEAIGNGIPAEKLEVIPHFTGKNIQDEYVETERDSILFVGRTDPIKGICELLQSLSFIRDRTWKTYIVGLGDGLQKYEKMAHDLGIKEKVVFLSNIDYADLDTYYQKASIVVFPSMSPESFGLVGIEAMSFGRPVVAFDVGGPREWLVDGKTGFLVKRGDVKEFSLRIEHLLEDASMAKQMGLEGQRRVNEHYRKEIHLKRLLSIYEDAIQKRGLKGN